MPCIKDERIITPRYHLGSHASSRKRPLRVPSHSCAVTCASRRNLCRWGSRPRNSETMFPRPFRAPFHQTGLSVAYLPAYSSLHRLWVDFVLFSKQFTRSDAGCQRGNPQEAAKTIAYNLCTIHKKTKHSAKTPFFSGNGTVLDCKWKAKLLSCFEKARRSAGT